MPDPAPRSLDRRVVALLAVVTGAAVANLYYVQPLLGTIGDALGVGEGTAGLLVTGSQVGYVLGLALVVPLGDLRERRGLVTTLLVLCAASSGLCALAPSFGLLLLTLALLGATSVAAQVLVPLASSLAGEHERGAVVGTVMSGLLVGILVARTVSGLLAELGSWRVVYVVAAVVMLAAAATLRAVLPVAPAPRPGTPYGQLLRSVLTLIGRERVLRERMLLGGLGFAAFSVLWTSIAFLLRAEPFGYSDGVIGLFGLAGVAGALAAPVAGRLADRAPGNAPLLAFLALVLLSWVPLALGGDSAVLLVVGIVLLDCGVQGAHITNQSRVYALAPDARSRLTTAYIVAYFLGGVGGSLLSSLAWEAGGWDAVCALGAVVVALALAIAAAATYRASAKSGGTIAR